MAVRIGKLKMAARFLPGLQLVQRLLPAQDDHILALQSFGFVNRQHAHRRRAFVRHAHILSRFGVKPIPGPVPLFQQPAYRRERTQFDGAAESGQHLVNSRNPAPFYILLRIQPHGNELPQLA